MSTQLIPVVGRWYRHLDKGQMFQVVALDTPGGTVELQHFDGDIEEIEQADWHGMDLAEAAAPEDWTGPVDAMEPDDGAVTETGMLPADWRRPLEEVAAPAQEAWEDATPEDELDDWGEGAALEVLLPEEELEVHASARRTGRR